MSELTDLATRYIKQREYAAEMEVIAERYKGVSDNAYEELQKLADQLKSKIDTNHTKLLIHTDTLGRYVLVHNVNGAYGRYQSIDVLDTTT